MKQDLLKSVSTRLNEREIKLLEQYLSKTGENRAQYIRRLILKDIEENQSTDYRIVNFQRKVLLEIALIKDFIVSQAGIDKATQLSKKAAFENIIKDFRLTNEFKE